MPEETNEQAKSLNPHDELTAELHKEAEKRNVTPAWLAQQPEWAKRLNRIGLVVHNLTVDEQRAWDSTAEQNYNAIAKGTE